MKRVLNFMRNPKLAHILVNKKMRKLTERMPAKTMIEPRSICHTEAYTYSSPIPAG